MSEDAGSSYNDYLQRLTKLIPGEAVSIYLTGKNMITPDDGQSICCDYWLMPLVGLVPLLLVRILGTRVQTAAGKMDVEWSFVLVSFISYIIWIYAIGDCFLTWEVPDGQGYLVAIAVLLWTFAVPYLYTPGTPNQGPSPA